MKFKLNENFDPLATKFDVFMPTHADADQRSATNKSMIHKKKCVESADGGSLTLEVCLIVFLLFLLQVVLALGGHSGFNTPPMYGDYEAQRHWMEITYHTPVGEWYKNTSSNDLLYWGLDYPPLTAYHHYVMGAIAHRVSPSWVALHSSRGEESPSHRMFMRATAITSHALLYTPAIIALAYTASLTAPSRLKPSVLALISLLYPGLIAIDNAHFQYNHVSLGFFLWSYICLVLDWKLVGSMELYHSLPIFVFILARCIQKPFLGKLHVSIVNLAKVGSVVVLTFASLWLPLLLTRSAGDALTRIFPFNRGLFEDKVASVWCAFGWLIKIAAVLRPEQQIKLSTVCVLAASLPSLAVLFLRPSPRNFRLSLLATSLAFFLFSYQVHEKSILLPAVAALLLLPQHPAIVCWFLHVSSTSMFSLCVKDGNASLLILFSAFFLLLDRLIFAKEGPITRCVIRLSCLFTLGVCLLETPLRPALLAPPSHLPHLYPLLNAFVSCCHFLALLGWSIGSLLVEEWTKRRSGEEKQKMQ